MQNKVSQITISMVINTNYGCYRLSLEASKEIARRKGMLTREENGYLYVENSNDTVDYVVPRNDPDLVAVVREMGEKAGADIKVVEVAVDIDIESHDGKETVSVSGGTSPLY